MKKVLIYSTPTCSYCRAAKAFFKEEKIKFTDIDVSKDMKKAQELVEKSGQMGVPVIDIDGVIVVGFDKMKIMEALDA